MDIDLDELKKLALRPTYKTDFQQMMRNMHHKAFEFAKMFAERQTGRNEKMRRDLRCK